MSAGESALGAAYRRTYEWLCGRHPHIRPWHFQWLATVHLYRDLRRVLPQLSGIVLDAGCGGKPYQSWFGVVKEYVGLDVVPGPAVDIVVAPDESWPLPSDHFDSLLSSQVLEHVAHLEHTVAEMHRVVRPGGTIVLSFPFLYNEHGAPFDYQRFTAHRAIRLFPGYEVVELRRQGGIATTTTILWLNWIEQSMNSVLPLRIIKAVLLPLWLAGCLLANLLTLAFDGLDRTQGYYSNLFLVLRKPQ